MDDGDRGVDAHVHLWDPRLLDIAWLRDLPALDRPVLEAEYAGAARPSGIVDAVLVEAAVDDESLESELSWIRRHVGEQGLVSGGVVGWRPAGDAGRTRGWLDLLADASGIVGVREVLHPADHGRAAPSAAARIAAAGEAGDRGLVVDVCARPDQLDAVRTLAAAVPGTRIVLDHLGRPRASEPVDPIWRADIERLAALPNVHVKISALIECAEGAPWTAASFEPFIATVLEAFGADRSLWGSNWPVCVATQAAFKAWNDATDACLAGHAEADRRAIRGGTARRVYRLPSG